MRRAKFRSASGSVNPKFCSSYSIRNSVPTGAGELVGHHAETGRQRMSGAKRARDQIDRFRELLLEFVHALGARPA